MRVHSVSRDPCLFAYPLVEVARAAGTPLGFETLPDCRAVGWGMDAEENGELLTDLTVRHAIDHLLRSAPEYSWREMDGVVVVRPKGAWTDAASPLQLRTDAVELEGSVNDALDALVRAARPSLYYEHGDVRRFAELMTREIRFSFQGGTFLDGLNALVRTHGRLEWVLEHQHLDLWLHTLEFPGDATVTPLAFPPRSRAPLEAAPHQP